MLIPRCKPYHFLRTQWIGKQSVSLWVGLMQRIPLCLLVLAFLFPGISYSQQPTILYVNRTDPSCAGKSPCYTTIQAAVTAARPGNIVRIHAGTYSERVTVSNKNAVAGSSELHRIVIEADPTAISGSVVVQPPPASCLNGHAILIRQSQRRGQNLVVPA